MLQFGASCGFVLQARVEGRVARWYIFKPKNTILGKFWGGLKWKILVCFMAIWYILQSIGKIL
jgi:hypothetical protein